MKEIMKMAKELMEMATEQELQIFDKVFRSTNDHVEEQLGHSKEEMIFVLMKTWANRKEAN